MGIALAYLLILFAAGILIAVRMRQARPTMTVLLSVLIYIPSYFVWFTLQYLHIVPVDALLRQSFGLESYQLVGTKLGTLVMFGPPLLPSIVIMLSLALARGRGA